ncbi:FAD/NAD(P)-binding domain-containing protein [Parathielavia appendiculata]|uniref:FAD/NAD(P)-binding domain-containing protein n=1 Tax=Parathielavia appendiculata TaxID=2587402 RepID=A0AAN6TUJ0_9PEZI|nr:FAD/NAD(P)-binding domain-containing protein [Parathielavia appendiculata]
MKSPQLGFVLALWLKSAASIEGSGYSNATIDVDVAIIGGGSGGIHSAIQLKDAGARVLVLEKKDQIGGHAETYINKETGVVNNIGVSVFEDTDVVKRYFARLGVPTSSVSASPPSTLYDFELGIPIPPPDEGAQQAILAAAKAYSQNVLSKYGWLDQGYFLPDPVPEELYMPIGDLAAKYNFTALLPIMARFNWHFGNQTKVPALYGIKDFGPDFLRSTFGQLIVSGTGNTRSLYDAALKELGSSVLLSTTILAVNRHSTGVTLLVSQNGMVKTIRAKKLLVAIPPTLQSLKSFDLSRSERALFSRFSSLGYFTGVARVPGWNSRSLANVGAFTPFHQPLIPGSRAFRATGTPDEFYFGVGFPTDQVADEDGKAVVRRQLATLAEAGAIPAAAGDAVTFSASSFHMPFNVRVGAADIKKGFYAELLALQGSRNTYWTGAAWAGHNSALVWKFNEGTIVPAIKEDLGLEHQLPLSWNSHLHLTPWMLTTISGVKH